MQADIGGIAWSERHAQGLVHASADKAVDLDQSSYVLYALSCSSVITEMSCASAIILAHVRSSLLFPGSTQESQDRPADTLLGAV